MINTTEQGVGELDRRTYIGSSDAAAIMGVGATYDGVTQTPFTVWQKKTGELAGKMDPDRQLFLNRRKRWEGPIVEMLREEFAGDIVAINERYRDPEHPWMAAEIDWQWRDSDGKIQNGETKTVFPLAFGERHGWGEPGSSDIPVHYAAQTTFGQMITGADTTIVAAMVGIDNMVFYRMERDEEVIAIMRAAVVKFWNDHVLTRIPPPPQNLYDIGKMYERYRGRPIEITETVADYIRKLDSLRGAKKANDLMEETLKFQIAEYICNEWGIPSPDNPPADTEDALLKLSGQPFATWNKQRGSFLDQKLLKKNHGDIVQDHTIEYFHRPIRLIKPKKQKGI